MDSKVVVSADKAGNVITKSSNNAEYGHITVKQSRMVVEKNGFARKVDLTALIPGTIDNLKGFGWAAGQEVEGKIVVKESLKPFNRKDPERNYKIAGKSGVVCSIDGQPIYRKHLFTLNPDEADVLLEHDNTDEINDAYAALEESGAEAGTSEEFKL